MGETAPPAEASPSVISAEAEAPANAAVEASASAPSEAELSASKEVVVNDVSGGDAAQASIDDKVQR